MSHGWEEREEKRLQLAAEAEAKKHCKFACSPPGGNGHHAASCPNAPVEEWAIQHHGNGKWWNGAQGGEQEPWGNTPYRSKDYRHLASSILTIAYDSKEARIVPAPPREMTNTEAEAWLHAQGSDWWVRATAQGTQAWKCGYGPLVGYGDTLHDAIRAAKKKLEGR